MTKRDQCLTRNTNQSGEFYVEEILAGCGGQTGVTHDGGG
jgi:hypothetical protein